MKVRQNKRRLLLNLRHNNKTLWFIAPYIQRSNKIKERNEKIKKTLDNM